jgi:hypothetical protein
MHSKTDPTEAEMQTTGIIPADKIQIVNKIPTDNPGTWQVMTTGLSEAGLCETIPIRQIQDRQTETQILFPATGIQMTE